MAADSAPTGAADPGDSTDDPLPGDRAAAALDRDELYEVVHAAVRDALLDVLGTLVLLAFALGLVAVGANVAFSGPSTAAVAAGAAIGLAGFAVAAAALDVLSVSIDPF